jgi:predicted amidophosphoribosyltransferase
MINKYSLHKIISPSNLSFSKIEYSKFKFGDGLIAEKFGNDLAKNFINEELANKYKGEQIVVVSSPYSFIPTATFFMKNQFVYTLNNWLMHMNHPVTQETKIHRPVSYSEDYGKLNAQERINLIGKDSFYIDQTFIKDKLILFLDDVRITGSHEKMITKMLSENSIKNHCYLLYFAELVNDLIEPNFENELNYAFVKSIFDLNEIISDSKFSINTRIVKYILNYEHENFKIFIAQKDEYFRNLLLNMAIGNSYHHFESYKLNLIYLQEILRFSKLKIISNGN